jgi:hypothetical protein
MWAVTTNFIWDEGTTDGEKGYMSIPTSGAKNSFKGNQYIQIHGN